MAHATHKTTFSGSENHGIQAGQNWGHIESHHHDAPGRAFTATQTRVGDNSSFRQGDDYHVTINSQEASKTPSSICDIPDLLTPHFFGRETELVGIQNAFEKEHGESPARCIIHGMHGVGKTQLALKYAERLWKERQCPYIFWISAASVDKLVAGFSKLLDLTGFAGRQALDQSARCTATRSWLEDGESQTKRKWLLVLDNTSPDALATLREMLPRGNSGGRILLTTRTKHTAEALAVAFGQRHVCIDLAPLAVDQSVRLLLRNSDASHHDRRNDEIQAAEHVVKSVGCLPLAVDQAASLLEVSGNTAQEVAQIYRSDQVEDALEWENDLSRYEESSVVATYTRTLEQVKHSPAGTSDLLRILAFMDPESILIEMLKYGCSVCDDEDLETVKLLLQNTVKLQKAVQSLQRLSLATRQNGGKAAALRIHDLVQLVLRTKLMNSADERKRWLGHSIRIACVAYERIEDPRSPASWEDSEPFVAQAHALQRHGERYDLTDEGLLTMRSWVASYLSSRGRYKESEKVNEDVLFRRKQVLGLEHPSTLTSMNNLAMRYSDQGRWIEAEKLEVQVMEIRKRVLGDEHPDTLCSMGNLASTYSNQGRWKEAEELEVQMMEISKRTLGDEHPRTLTSINNLASTYWDQDRWAEAEELQEQVIEIRKRVLGDEHPQTLISMNNLASTYRKQGRWKEAEKLKLQVTETHQRVLGDEHPDTLRSMNNLASTYRDQGRWAEAEELDEQVIEIRKRVLDDEHPETLTSMVNLACTLKVRGKPVDAITLMEKCVRLRTQVLGAGHPDTISASDALLAWRAEEDR